MSNLKLITDSLINIIALLINHESCIAKLEESQFQQIRHIRPSLPHPPKPEMIYEIFSFHNLRK